MTHNGKRPFVISAASLPTIKLELSQIFQKIVMELPPSAALDFTDWLCGQARELSGEDALDDSRLIPSAN